MTHLKRQNTLLCYVRYEPYTEMSSAAYYKVVFVIFLS